VIRGLLLDFDGTLCDSITQSRTSFSKFLSREGVMATPHDFDEFNGLTLETVVDLLIDDGTLQGDAMELIARYRAGLEQDIIHAPPADGASALLHVARDKGIKVAIVSSGRAQAIAQWLRAQEIGHLISTIIGVEDVRNGKPDPEPYLRAMENLELNPMQCWAVEDSYYGARSAFDAGVQTFVLGSDSFDGCISVGCLDEVTQTLVSSC
jgi:HAD superfamily hydrolase (TIGR01509 family)